jgi:hypothetical protein
MNAPLTGPRQGTHPTPNDSPSRPSRRRASRGSRSGYRTPPPASTPCSRDEGALCRAMGACATLPAPRRRHGSHPATDAARRRLNRGRRSRHRRCRRVGLVVLGRREEAVAHLAGGRRGLRGEVAEQFGAAVNQPVAVAVEREPGVARPGGSPREQAARLVRVEVKTVRRLQRPSARSRRRPHQ